MREATRDDMLELVRMARAFAEAADLPFDRNTFADTVESLIDSANGVIFIDEGGMIGGLLYPSYFHPDYIVAQELFWWVDPDKRGDGLGVRLLQAFERWGKDSGATRVIMLALQALTPRKIGKLYTGQGYRPLERSYVKDF